MVIGVLIADMFEKTVALIFDKYKTPIVRDYRTAMEDIRRKL